MKYLPLLLSILLTAQYAIAAVVTAASVPTSRANGFTVTASVWNADVLGIYTYLNTNIVAAINTITTKGDLYVYDGSAIQRQAVGTDGQVLTADSAKSNGIKYAAFSSALNLTSKGDMITYAGAATALPVGADGQVLIADSTKSTGLKYGTAPGGVPSGTIIAWSPTGAGTSTIPTSWVLCDGTNSSPNLIGKFIIGSKPSGSASTPNAKGYGYIAADSAGSNVLTHTHTISVSATTGGANTTVGAVDSGVTIGSNSGGGHTHTFGTVTGSPSSASTEPAAWALVYIMKQ